MDGIFHMRMKRLRYHSRIICNRMACMRRFGCNREGAGEKYTCRHQRWEFIKYPLCHSCLCFKVVLVPCPVGHDVRKDCDSTVDVTFVQIQWCYPEPDNIRCAEIPNDTLRDKRLNDRVTFGVVERYLAAARGPVAWGSQTQVGAFGQLIHLKIYNLNRYQK